MGSGFYNDEYNLTFSSFKVVHQHRGVRMQSFLRFTGCFLMALVVAGLLGTIVQTQFNLLELQRLGVPISFGLRLQTTLQDIVGFAPAYLGILAAGLLPSLLVALLLVRPLVPRHKAALSALAAAVGLWAAFKATDMVAPMPTLIAATRSGGGTMALLATSALGGWLFSRLYHANSRLPQVQPVIPMLLLAMVSVLLPKETQASDRPYQTATWVDGLAFPWSMTFLPDGRALVTEKPGRLRIVGADGRLHAEPVAGVPDVLAKGQGGLKEILLAPDFEQSQRIYLSYSCGTMDANHACLATAKLNENRLENLQEIFRSQPARSGGAAHYGARMAWLADGTLILTLGDGFDYREEAQRLDNHFGKVVRLNADGSVPANNPFVDRAGVAPEIYSYGHRNVQGIVYDANNKRLLTHEHGPRGGDELNRIVAGANYGWPIATAGLDYTGARVTPFKDYKGTQQPLLGWTPSIAPSGMALYKGDAFAAWKGDLLVSALAARNVQRVRLDGDKVVEAETLFEELGERIRHVVEGPDGNIYLLIDSEKGRIVKVTPVSA